jgi:hypothetical protein
MLQFEQRTSYYRMLKGIQFIVAFENSIADDHVFIDVAVVFAKLATIMQQT